MKLNDIMIIEDSREQTPLDFSPFESIGISVERRKLRTGDYSIKGYERQIFIERKSLQDCVSTLTHGRERFTREVYDRGAFSVSKHLVIEASWQELSRPYKFSAANPESIVNSLFAIQLPPVGMHVFCDKSRRMIAWYIVKVATMFVRRVTNGTSGMWRSLFAENSADLPPFSYEK